MPNASISSRRTRARWRRSSRALAASPQQLESNGIKADTLKSAQDSAQTRAAALHLDATAASIVATLVRANLKVNFLQTETALKRQQASDAVPAVFVTVAQGQTIIRYGDLVTPFQLEERRRRWACWRPRPIGLASSPSFMMVIILFALALGYLMQFRPAILRDPRQLGTLGGLMLVLLIVAKLVVPINPTAQYLVPMAAVPMLVATLMDTGLGIIVALAVGLLTGIVADNVLPLTWSVPGRIGSISCPPAGRKRSGLRPASWSPAPSSSPWSRSRLSSVTNRSTRFSGTACWF